MRSILLIVSFSAAAAWAQEIPSGTHLLLSLEQSLSTARSKSGDHVALRVDTPLVVGGTVVLPIGSYAQGELTLVKRGGRIRGRAELHMRLVHFITPDGRVIGNTAVLPRIQQNFGDARPTRYATSSSVGAGTAILMGGLLGGAASGSEAGAKVGLFGAVGFGVLQAMLRRGQELDLPRGTTLDFVMP